MKIKSIKTSYDYKKLKDFKIGDSVVTTDGLKAKVLDIPSDKDLEIKYEGATKKIKANELLYLDLEKVEL